MNFPYVCPEPVLVKTIVYIYINGSKKAFFAPVRAAPPCRRGRRPRPRTARTQTARKTSRLVRLPCPCRDVCPEPVLANARVCVFSPRKASQQPKRRAGGFPSPAQRPLRTANHDAVCPSCAHRHLRRTIRRPNAPYPRQSAMTLTTRCGGGSRAPGRPSYASGHRLRSEKFQELNTGQKAPGITKRRSRAPPPTLMPPMIVSSR